MKAVTKVRDLSICTGTPKAAYSGCSHEDLGVPAAGWRRERCDDIKEFLLPDHHCKLFSIYRFQARHSWMDFSQLLNNHETFVKLLFLCTEFSSMSSLEHDTHTHAVFLLKGDRG